MKNKCGGVIVLYNPNESVISNIESYINHIDILIAVDNSDTINHSLIINLSKNSKIQYINNNGNQGIAHALNIGANKAISMGYEWLLTMDQDSRFEYEMITNYLDCWLQYKEKEKIAIFAPQYEAYNFVNNNFCQAATELIVITSGNILNLSLFQKIGQFEEKLFIDEVDHDYCLRAKRLGFYIIKFKNIFLEHKLGEPKIILRNGKKTIFRSHATSRYYYIIRNGLYICRTYAYSYPTFTGKRLLYLFKIVIFVLLYDDKRLERAKNILRGFYHFLVGKYGK
ncbi:MAG: glycosyltransferase [Sulfuricurvum sp.]|nr:glycosyltransferase [Sulfuricurvum sp.]